ncbi:ABC transporter substrate-binding protein [Streptomyces sp. 110]|uniref:ABC transporter substrate-binding protein n=1 Tax=Streptomyces endocoffeicus TaxID=2898945 RepID=A0ABS1Q9T3_9ACTN|nr:ABC transporter substrate-binding protein [Streptomyces endocoffeicus]MBL1120937.1 ABC transporter substrate-binding protein [Streptomyces endocoffeicus]
MTRRPLRPRFVAFGSSTLLLSGLISGCSSSSGAAESGGSTPVQGGTITYAHVQEPSCIFGGWIQQAYISRQILDGLVTEDDNGAIKPWLATAWTVSPDGLSYTFTLKSGVKFTDGTPVDAAAIAWNFDLWENHSGNASAKVSMDPYYKSAKALDPTHVKITLNKPFPQFLRLITQGYYGIQSPTAFKSRTRQENCEKPIGSGAFKVKQWKRGEEVVLVKNPNYTSWPATAKHHGPAIVNEVDWKFVADGVSRYASLTTGQANVVYQVPTSNWTDAQQKYQPIRFITPGKPVSFNLNTKQGVFTDKLVRQAFAYGADRKAAVKAGFHGVIPYEGNPALDQATPDYNAQAAQAYPFDQAKANALLDRAGWRKGAAGIRTKNGKRLTVRLVYGSGYVLTKEGETVLQILQEQWKQTGFEVKLIPATQAEGFSGKYSSPSTYDATPEYWCNSSPAVLWIVWRPTTKAAPNYNNESFYNNDQLAKTIQQANTEQDTAKAGQLYQKAQQVVQDNAVSIGLYPQTSLYAVAKNLKNVWLEKSQGEPVFSDAYFTK